MKKDWKYYLGIALIVYSFIPYIVSATLPFFGLSAEAIASIAAGLIISAEVAFLSAVALLGKQFIEMLKLKFKRFFTRAGVPSAPRPISKGRHYFGISLLLLSFITYLAAEISLILGYTKACHINFIIGLLLTSDALLVVSLFVLGGDFWERLKKLFEWHGDQRQITA